MSHALAVQAKRTNWPPWTAMSYNVTVTGSVAATINSMGGIDWGCMYTYVSFPINGMH